ncbi:MAG: M56 family metallopeptidase, partial [Pirellulaceae bacterium]|nr:M56 family metallopeptidase [Pirellulaceae bacterium]
MWNSVSDSTISSHAAAFVISLLVDSTIKAAILLALVAAVMSLSKKVSAATRHLVWLLSLAVIPALPILVLILPTWNVLPNWLASPAGRARPIASQNVYQPSSAMTLSQSPSDGTLHEPTSQPSNGTGGDEVNRPRTGRAPITLNIWATTMQFLLVAWLSGCLLSFAPWLVGSVSLRLLQRRSARVKEGRLLLLLHEFCTKLGIRRPVQLLVSDQREMPMQWGVISPKVHLPSSALTWPEDRLTAVLMHELSHVRRHDCLTQFFTTIVAALYWFHPMVWWAGRQMKDESEFACDDLTISSGCRATEYAQQVLYVAASSYPAPLFSPVAIGMAGRSRLEERVRAILDRGRNRTPLTMTGGVACSALILMISAPLVLLGDKPSNSTSRTTLESRNDANQHLNSQDTRSDSPLRRGFIEDSAEGKRSIAGSGHAVAFQRPAATKYLMSVEIFASRYGTPDPPDEDFHIYLLDEKQKLFRA